ncbi:MAG: capsule assembly Wzi family protein [Treponema sp.]|jgi:hypothetical protein|nr:capsule assembly Wzi family protein [Treponema sp.]
MKKCLFLVFIITAYTGYTQEILLSPNEVYYDFLSLGGYIDRPYLNYRTLSDSAWNIDDNTNAIWSDVNLGLKKNINDKISYKIYGPELFTSFNSAYPYGQNDSTLWQGRGFNTFFSAGARLELYGFELTLRPEIAFSQNGDYNMPLSAYSGSKYGYFWGIGTDIGVDAPQRFGGGLYYEFSWGDSEIRYSWKTLTVGFGTQNIWLGPAKINSILLSNNAPPWLKFDIGIRKQPITIRDVYLGDIEARAFWGRLSESDFFDNNSSNDHNLITGFTFAYSFPSLLEGFTIGINRVTLSRWHDRDLSSIYSTVLYTDTTSDSRDQRAVIFANYLFASVGFEIYFEWGRNDFSTLNAALRDLFDTEAYTIGAAKSFLFNNDLQGKLLLEISRIDSARDWPTTFYAHHLVVQGHTNRGQWLGAGIGTGGNSQYLGFTLFYKKGYADLFIQRQSIDNDYVRYIIRDTHYKKALLSFGVDNYINLYKHLGLYTRFVYSLIHNPAYDASNHFKDNNFYISLGIKTVF